jgi:hypothetical protein
VGPARCWQEKTARRRLFCPLALGWSQVGERQGADSHIASFFQKLRQQSLIISDPVDFFLVIFHSVTRASLATAGSEGRDCWGSICVPHPEPVVRPRGDGGERGAKRWPHFLFTPLVPARQDGWHGAVRDGRRCQAKRRRKNCTKGRGERGATGDGMGVPARFGEMACAFSQPANDLFASRRRGEDDAGPGQANSTPLGSWGRGTSTGKYWRRRAKRQRSVLRRRRSPTTGLHLSLANHSVPDFSRAHVKPSAPSGCRMLASRLSEPQSLGRSRDRRSGMATKQRDWQPPNRESGCVETGKHSCRHESSYSSAGRALASRKQGPSGAVTLKNSTDDHDNRCSRL